jgi:hypothetical protein
MAEASAEELAGEILGEISNDVFELTGGDRYRAGQPLQGDPSVEKPEASGPPAPESAEAAKPETEPAPEGTSRDEKGRFIAKEAEWFLPGLYKTQEDAIKGIHETKRYASEALDRKKAAEAELEKLKTPAPAETVSDPLTELEVYGVPKELMQKAIESGSKRAMQQIFEPMARRIDADQKIVSMYPEYGPKFTELAAFVESQPELKQKVERAESSGEFLLARELAWLNFERFNAAKSAEVTSKKTEHQVAAAKEKMADAAVTKPSQAETRTRPSAQSPNDIPDEKFTDLMELAKAGYPSPLWRSTIGAVLEREYPTVFGPTPTPGA